MATPFYRRVKRCISFKLRRLNIRTILQKQFCNFCPTASGCFMECCAPTRLNFVRESWIVFEHFLYLFNLASANIKTKTLVFAHAQSFRACFVKTHSDNQHDNGYRNL